jgi:hypothetical protein
MPMRNLKWRFRFLNRYGLLAGSRKFTNRGQPTGRALLPAEAGVRVRTGAEADALTNKE